VEDVIDANMAVISQPVSGAFNVGTGEETSVNQLFQYLIEITGARVKELHGPERRGEQKRSVLSCAKIAEAVDWGVRTPLLKGLEKTVDYFRSILK
jgi:UDP-glucose 4-epimerase